MAVNFLGASRLFNKPICILDTASNAPSELKRETRSLGISQVGAFQTSALKKSKASNWVPAGTFT